MRKIFWNSAESRLRAFWRISFQQGLLIILLIPLQIPGVWLFYTSLQADPPADLASLQLSTDAITELFLRYPGAVLLSSLGLFIAILISVWLTARYIDRRPFAAFGLHLSRDWWQDLGFGFFLGAALMLVIFLLELALGWVRFAGWAVHPVHISFWPAAVITLLNYIIAGFHEELYSRGYQLRNLAEGFNGLVSSPLFALLLANFLTAVLFGLLHIFNPNASLLSTVNIFLAGGILLSAGYLFTGELAIPTGVHIAWNLFQGGVFGFPVSGGRIGGVSLIAIEQSGPVLWTGGAFGPEAGLLGLLAILLGAFLIALYVRLRQGSLHFHVDLTRYHPHSSEGSN